MHIVYIFKLIAQHLSPTPERINIHTCWMTCFGLGFGRGGVPRKEKHKKLGDLLWDGEGEKALQCSVFLGLFLALDDLFWVGFGKERGTKKGKPKQRKKKTKLWEIYFGMGEGEKALQCIVCFFLADSRMQMVDLAMKQSM